MKDKKGLKDNVLKIFTASLIFLIGCSSEIGKNEEDFTPDIIVSPKLHSTSYCEEFYDDYLISEVKDDNLSALITFDDYLSSDENDYEVKVIMSEEFIKNNNEELKKAKVLTKHLS